MRHVLAAGLILALSSAPALAVSAADRARMAAGETVVTSVTEAGMPGIEASFLVHATPEAAYQVLADTDHLIEFMPAMKACDVLERGAGYVVVRMVGDAGEIVQKRRFAPPDRIEWTLVNGTGLRDLRGHWWLEPAGGQTIVHYQVVVRPALPVPSSLVQYFQSRNLPDMVHNVRERIESGGTWLKPGAKRVG